jgi:sporulation protein YlmC with PRC-barrel domain
MADTLDLALTVLDRQLIDSHGRRCGRVDDILLTGEPGKPANIDALLIGQAAAAERLPRALRWLMQKLVRSTVIQVPWADVYQVSHVVKLSKSADELGLAAGDRRATEWFSKIPTAL